LVARRRLAMLQLAIFAVAALVLGQSLSLALIGIALGLAGSMIMGGLMSSLLFDVKPRDPLTFVTVAAVLTLVALIASYLSARRATKVDPVVSLRYE
jgi:putative ABC transport system permease protein